jgi:hypothetical protein
MLLRRGNGVRSVILTSWMHSMTYPSFLFHSYADRAAARQKAEQAQKEAAPVGGQHAATGGHLSPSFPLPA